MSFVSHSDLTLSATSLNNGTILTQQLVPSLIETRHQSVQSALVPPFLAHKSCCIFSLVSCFFILSMIPFSVLSGVSSVALSLPVWPCPLSIGSFE